MTEIKIQNGCWQRSDIKCVNEKELITAKTALQCRTLKARKGMVNGWEAKVKVQTSTKYNMMHKLEHVQKGVVQTQDKGKWQ